MRKNPDVALITGASGYLGQALGHALKTVKPKIKTIGLARRSFSGFDVCLRGDMSDAAWLNDVLKKYQPDLIFHMAAHIHGGTWDDFFEVNVELTTNLLETVKSACAYSRVVVSGSAAEYGRVEIDALPITELNPFNPISPYGLSKVFQNQIALYFSSIIGLDIVIPRTFNLIGPGIPPYLVVGSFEQQLQNIRDGRAPPIVKAGNLQTTRDFVDVSDAATGILATAFHGERGQAYNICTNNPVSIGRILSLMASKAGVNIKIEEDMHEASRANLPQSYGSYEKLNTASGWRPTISIEQSVDRIFNSCGTRA